MRRPCPPAVTHAKLIITGSKNPALYNKLITLYDSPNSLTLFENLPFPPKPSSYTSLISSSSSPLSLFLSHLRNSPPFPNEATLSFLLKTFSLSSFPFCLQLHSLSLKLSLSSLPFLASSLLTSYSKNSCVSSALQVFDEITQRDSVCYSAIITALSQNNQPLLAISHFNSMRRAEFASTEHSVSGALRSAAHLAALDITKSLHSHAVTIGFDTDLVVGTAIVDAFGKAGMASDARNAFERMGRINVVTWNAVASAYAQQGDYANAERMFDRMAQSGCVPDKVTFLAVLTAFGNAGIVTETERWLGLMTEPGVEHYTCLVGALSCVGRLEEVEKLISKESSFVADAAVWRTILAGCVVHARVDVGERVSRRLLEINPRDESTYVMLVNIYASLGMKDEISRVRTQMRENGVIRERGRSWIEAGGEVHVFIAGDTKHEKSREIYEQLSKWKKEVRRLGRLEDGEWEWQHSERLG